MQPNNLLFSYRGIEEAQKDTKAHQSHFTSQEGAKTSLFPSGTLAGMGGGLHIRPLHGHACGGYG